MALSATFRTLTPQEVAESLQIGVRQVYKWIQDGDLPAVRLGRVYRVQPDDLQRFLLERKTARRSRVWQGRFDRALGQSQAALRRYLEAQGMQPGEMTDEQAEQVLHDASRR